WQPQPQIKALGIDRFQFPLERIGAAGAMAAGKTGHARQRHREKFSERGDETQETRATIGRFHAKWNRLALRRTRASAAPPGASWSIAPLPAGRPVPEQVLAEEPGAAPAASPPAAWGCRSDWYRRRQARRRPQAAARLRPARRCRSGSAFPSRAAWRRSSDAR